MLDEKYSIKNNEKDDAICAEIIHLGRITVKNIFCATVFIALSMALHPLHATPLVTRLHNREMTGRQSMMPFQQLFNNCQKEYCSVQHKTQEEKDALLHELVNHFDPCFIWFRSRKIISALIFAGANPNTSGINGSFLYDAALRDDCEIAHLLLVHGADPNQQNVVNHTALHATKSIAMAQLLCKYNAHVKTYGICADLTTSLMRNNRPPELVEWFLNNGADVNPRYTPLHQLAYIADKGLYTPQTIAQLTTMFLKAGINKNAINRDNRTALDIALESMLRLQISETCYEDQNIDATLTTLIEILQEENTEATSATQRIES